MAPNPRNQPQTPPVGYKGDPALMAGPQSILPAFFIEDDAYAMACPSPRMTEKMLISDPEKLKELEKESWSWKMNNIYVDNRRFTIDGVEYSWSGGFGALFYSNEKNLKEGDLRAIGDIIFKVFSITKYNGIFKKYYSVAWCPVQKIDHEWIEKFRRAVFL